MPTGYILRAYLFDGTLIHERGFTALPIRIGRNSLNDFQISQSLISGFHAVLEPLHDKVYLRDLGSRNGVLVRHMKTSGAVRIAPQTPVDLEALGFEFFLGPQVQVRVQPTPPEQIGHRDAGRNDGMVLGNAQMLQVASADPSPLPPHRIPPAVSPPRQTAEPPPPGTPAGYRAPPPVTHGSVGGARSTRDGVRLGTGHFGSLALDTLALQGLQELASSLVPDKTMQTSGDVARFITKLHDAIDVFCRCFIPLREGYAQFVSSLDLQRAANMRSTNRSRAYQQVEGARDPEELAMGLLDWTDRSLDGHKAVENIYADLMIHQVALLDGVMQGVRALLDELSPEAISEHTGQGKFSVSARYKDLWQAYCDRYEDLAEERQAFARIFGHEFTQAYREYRRRKQVGDAT